MPLTSFDIWCAIADTSHKGLGPTWGIAVAPRDWISTITGAARSKKLLDEFVDANDEV